MRKLLLLSLLVLAFSEVSVEARRQNPTYSPDSSLVAFTCDNDLYVCRADSTGLCRLTSDGSDVILNGRASWVYYEEILGRASRYKAFWWSPDGRKIAFYRFDNSKVPVFSIYSAASDSLRQGGFWKDCAYPKAGQDNPSVRIGIIDLDRPHHTVWADFPEDAGQYFGTPFWGSDSRSFYVQHMDRRQNVLDLYAVDITDGHRSAVYHEEYPTWTEFLDNITFTDKGLYFVRSFETLWEQAYFLSYDGKEFRRLTEGSNWNMSIVRVDEKKGELWFTAKRDSRLRPSLYKRDRRGRIQAMTSPDFWVKDVRVNDDGRSFQCTLGNARTPWIQYDSRSGEVPSVAEDTSDRPYPREVRIENDGYSLYGLMCLPRNFDPSRKYPVVIEVYGGPNTAYVRDRWEDRDASNRWCWENGIIWMVVDPRSSGENGRKGLDEAFGRMTVTELDDYLAWARWLQGLPYVRADRIASDGFSFGGTTTAMLVFRYPEYFHCGIAGGGVYDWRYYDSVYTERFMMTPSRNPEGYSAACVLNYVEEYDPDRSMILLTHGTGDDNVHFQNTLSLIDALQKAGKRFELMIYPDGMHGYRDAQKEHCDRLCQDFWTRCLLD